MSQRIGEDPIDLRNGRYRIALNRRWSLDEVLTAMTRGDTFHTRGETTGRIANVERYNCASCNRTYIRSTPDAVQDNNLDNLPSCKW